MAYIMAGIENYTLQWLIKSPDHCVASLLGERVTQKKIIQARKKLALGLVIYIPF